MTKVKTTSEKWLKDNPQVTKQELLDELIMWRTRATTYQKQLNDLQIYLAEIKYLEDKKFAIK